MGDIGDSLTQWLMVIGLIALITEVVVLGFSTFFLFFVGFSLLITSALMHFDILEPTFLNAVYSCAILSSLLAIFLWKPLKKIQNSQGEKNIPTDFADITFILEADLNPETHYKYAYSGIQWQVKAQRPLAKGTLVKVVKKEVGKFWVEPVN